MSFINFIADQITLYCHKPCYQTCSYSILHFWPAVPLTCHSTASVMLCSNQTASDSRSCFSYHVTIRLPAVLYKFSEGQTSLSLLSLFCYWGHFTHIDPWDDLKSYWALFGGQTQTLNIWSGNSWVTDLGLAVFYDDERDYNMWTVQIMSNWWLVLAIAIQFL